VTVEPRPDDVSYTLGVRADLLRRVPHLRGRPLFLTGISNGGSMVFRVGCEASEAFRAMAAVVGSLEMRNATDCGCDCADGGDGYTYCAWDERRPGCRRDDWLNSGRELIYSCPMRRSKPPLLMFNGRLDELTNISGVVELPTNRSNATAYYENYSPIGYVWKHFARAYGCSGDARLSFSNGTAGNSTQCFSFGGCASNVTYCLSDAGGGACASPVLIWSIFRPRPSNRPPLVRHDAAARVRQGGHGVGGQEPDSSDEPDVCAEHVERAHDGAGVRSTFMLVPQLCLGRA